MSDDGSATGAVLAKSVVIEVRLYVKMVNYNRNSGLCIIYGGLEKIMLDTNIIVFR